VDIVRLITAFRPRNQPLLSNQNSMQCYGKLLKRLVLAADKNWKISLINYKYVIKLIFKIIEICKIIIK